MIGEKVYINTIGTRVRFITDEDLTNMSSLVVKVKKPDDTEVEWTPVIVENIAKGIIYYDTVAGDQDQAGTYFVQAYVIFNDGDDPSSHTRSYVVYDYFD